MQEHVKREKQIMAECDCPFMVNLVTSFKDAAHLYMLMECVMGGELFTYLQSRAGPLKEDHARFYAASVILGLEYMQDRNLMWRYVHWTQMTPCHESTILLRSYMSLTVNGPNDMHTTQSYANRDGKDLLHAPEIRHVCMQSVSFLCTHEGVSLASGFSFHPCMESKDARCVTVFSLGHRDLKPENLLIDTTGYVKMADFGFAKKLPTGQKSSTLCGTPEYLAPELVTMAGHNHAVDWYAYNLHLTLCPGRVASKATRQTSAVIAVLCFYSPHGQMLIHERGFETTKHLGSFAVMSRVDVA